MKSHVSVVGRLLVTDIIFVDFSHALLVLHAFRMWMGRYNGIPTSCVRLQIGAGICTVPAADKCLKSIATIW